MRALFVVGLLLPSGALAGSGADALLRAAAVPQGQATSPEAHGFGQIKLTDPFLMQFFSAWKSEKNLPFEAESWASRIVQQDFLGAAHLWSAVQPKLPDSFFQAAATAHAYCLWKLDLRATFIDFWLTQMRDREFQASKTAESLELAMSEGIDRWLEQSGLAPTPEQDTLIQGLPLARSQVALSFRAWASLRKGPGALDVLEVLPPNHAFKIPLAQSLALALARKKDLAGAAAVLKKHVEPTLEAQKNAAALSSHSLQIARLLYQAGSMDGAEQYYSRIPNGSPDFHVAREELTWVWLRQGNVERLRGELETLSSNIFEDRFSPEVELVKAISNLKLCYYDQVEKGFERFLTRNRQWAAKITAALKEASPPAPRNRDSFTRAADLRLERLTAEASRLEQLAEESIIAALPAVGKQGHWIKAKDRVMASHEQAGKIQAQEYRRQWKSDHAALQEAIRKMKFVKIELMSQIRMASRPKSPEVIRDSIRLTAAAPAREEVSVVKSKSEEMVFPFDGVMWPDELFKLRSAAQGRCLAGIQGDSR